jgi:hypothetical protein
MTSVELSLYPTSTQNQFPMVFSYDIFVGKTPSWMSCKTMKETDFPFPIPI